MKNFFRVALIILSIAEASFSYTCSAQMKLNMSLLSRWTDTTLAKNWTTGSFNDCWGYADSLGREYAIIGSTMGTHIFDITNAANPVLVSFQPGRESSANVVHRDFKTYRHYLYAVCDEGNSSLQIFDLKYMPDSVHKVYDSQHICKTAHTIFIYNGRLYFCGMKDSTTTPITFRVASLANPINPVVINDLSSPPFSGGYVHAVHVRNDTAFLSCANDGLFIYDYTNPTAPVLIQSITQYPQQGYNHSSWVSDDGKILVFADETHGTGLKVYDISDFSNITLKSIFRSNLLKVPDSLGPNGSIPHNPFIVGNRVVVSYYQDGVQVFDISNTSSPFQAGYYDTFPENTDYIGYGPGCWGVYPYLPSHHIIASDIAHGLFILDGKLFGVNDGVNEWMSSFSDAMVFPNPTSGIFTVTVGNGNQPSVNYQLSIYNVVGEKIYQSQIQNTKSQILMDISSCNAGIYLMKITGKESSITKKIIKAN